MPDVIVEELPEDQQPPKSPDSAQQTDSKEHLFIAKHFNIDVPSKNEENKLIEIWEHGKSLSRTGELQDILWQIMHLQRTLGAPQLGEAPLDKIYRWAKLKRQQKQIDEELQTI